MATKCTSCGAEILWRNHVKTGKPAPIDAEETPDGNVVLLDGEDTYMLITQVEADFAPLSLHKNHFATCPGANTFRR